MLVCPFGCIGIRVGMHGTPQRHSGNQILIITTSVQLTLGVANMCVMDGRSDSCSIFKVSSSISKRANGSDV